MNQPQLPRLRFIQSFFTPLVIAWEIFFTGTKMCHLYQLCILLAHRHLSSTTKNRTTQTHLLRYEHYLLLWQNRTARPYLSGARCDTERTGCEAGYIHTTGHAMILGQLLVIISFDHVTGVCSTVYDIV